MGIHAQRTMITSSSEIIGNKTPDIPKASQTARKSHSRAKQPATSGVPSARDGLSRKQRMPTHTHPIQTTDKGQVVVFSFALNLFSPVLLNRGHRLKFNLGYHHKHALYTVFLHDVAIFE